MKDFFEDHVNKFAETLNVIVPPLALRIIEQMERVEIHNMPDFIDTLFDGKDNMPEVLKRMENLPNEKLPEFLSNSCAA